jgi:hypothetical protein
VGDVGAAEVVVLHAVAEHEIGDGEHEAATATIGFLGRGGSSALRIGHADSSPFSVAVGTPVAWCVPAQS